MMDKIISPYYPPRARWYAPVFRLTGAVRRGLALDRIRLPSEITWRGLALSFLIPGLGFYLRGPRLYGKVALAACGFLLLVFVAWLGFPLANLAFGLLMSTHVSGFVYYCNPALNGWRLRVLFTVLVLMSVGILLYGSLRDMVQSRLFMPLSVQGRVIVVSKLAPASEVKRGDWVAYRINRFNEYGDDERLRIHSGTGFGPVLGVAGDRVQFCANGFRINGILKPSLPYMPSAGSFVVPEKHWFIWPNYRINGNDRHANLGSVLFRLADVSVEQYAGKPFKRWFWRGQTLP